MRFDRLFTKLFARPVLLEAATRIGFETALLTLMEGGTFDHVAAQFDARKVAPERAQKQAESILEVRGSTAIIHVDGTIDKNLSSWDRLCLDATDLRDVDQALVTVANDRTIKNVLLAIDSPGGSVTGVPETADRIEALAKLKNVFAFTEGMCCSAAYWLAAGADQIFSTSSAQMGQRGRLPGSPGPVQPARQHGHEGRADQRRQAQGRPARPSSRSATTSAPTSKNR